MATQSVNLYPGVNAHLNSYLQQPEGGWEMFHARYIADIAVSLDSALPMNYYAVAEKSLQISEIRDEDDYLTGVAIYAVHDSGVPGKLVTRLELLSPANKPPNAYYRQYLTKWIETLRSGVSLVEIDYLHEQRPIIHRIPSYRDGDGDAKPYNVIVSNPYTERTDIYLFGVDEGIPQIPVPLMEERDTLLDLNAVYQQSFALLKVFAMLTDYSQPPKGFNRYSSDDQKRILEVMRRFNQA
jgi:hypothetical protein